MNLAINVSSPVTLSNNSEMIEKISVRVIIDQYWDKLNMDVGHYFIFDKFHAMNIPAHHYGIWNKQAFLKLPFSFH